MDLLMQLQYITTAEGVQEVIAAISEQAQLSCDFQLRDVSLVSRTMLKPPTASSPASDRLSSSVRTRFTPLLCRPRPTSVLSFENWTCPTSARELPARVEPCPPPARRSAPQKENCLQFDSISRVVVLVHLARRLPPPPPSVTLSLLLQALHVYPGVSVYKPPCDHFSKNGSFVDVTSSFTHRANSL